MRHILLVLLLVAASAEARAEKLPAFTDYPTVPAYRGPMARPILNSAQARSYRTRLLEAAHRAPNFAGRFRLVDWGCGTSCSQGAVEDVVTGQVIFLPFSICCYVGPMDAPDWDAIEVKSESRLIVFHGQRNDEGVNGDHYYAFDGRSFRFLTTKEVTAPQVPEAGTQSQTDQKAEAASAGATDQATSKGNKVDRIPSMFQGVWKQQKDGAIGACHTNKNDPANVTIGVDFLEDANGRGVIDRGTLSTTDTATGYNIDSMIIRLSYGDDEASIETETWSIKEINGQRVLVRVRSKSKTLDLLTRCTE